MEKYYFLKEDLECLGNKIDELKIKIREAQEDKNITVEQSSETWHDNYGFEECVRQVRRLKQEIDKLTEIYNKATISPEPEAGKICVGNAVVMKDESGKEIKTKIGSFLILEQSKSISYASPLGKLLLGAKIGEIKEGLINGKLKKFKIISVK